MTKRLITLQMIKAEKIARSRSWTLAKMAAGEFPQPAVRGNPNLWLESDVDKWLSDFVAQATLRDAAPDTHRVLKSLGGKRPKSPGPRA